MLLPLGSGAAGLALGTAPARRIRLRASALTLVEPAVRLALAPAEAIEFLLLRLTPEHVEGLSDRAAPGGTFRLEPMTDWADPAVAALGQEIRRAMLGDGLSDGTYVQALADALVVRLICRRLGELDHADSPEALSPGRLARIVAHIDANLDRTIRVERLAEMAGLSRSHFSRAFQRMTGDPPQRFVLKRRVCRARDLLAADDAGIAQIALRTGFSSQAHLSTAFLREVGATPARYRAAFRPRPAQRVLDTCSSSGEPSLSSPRGS
jgi:AraC family transcriptional regulator